MSTQISDLKDKINAADPENFQAVTSWFTTWQDDFNVRVDSMIQGIEEPYAEIELQVSLGRAQGMRLAIPDNLFSCFIHVHTDQ